MTLLARLCLFFFVWFSPAQGVYEDEKKLHKELFNDYESNIIPREFKGGPIIANFDLSLQSLNSFKWKDERLKWEYDKYPDVYTISVEPKSIWTPDIVLYNTAQVKSASHLDIYKSRPIISSDGWITWNAPVTWEVSCDSDVTWFPIDKQVCEMFFASWSYDDLHLAIWPFDNTSRSVGSYFKVFQVENGEWNVKSITSKERLVSFQCCKNPFSSIVYKIELERLSSFYFIYIIIPLIALAFLFLFVFHIPFDSGERTGFGVTVLLSITVYLLVISEKLPEKSDTSPLLGSCFIAIFFLLCIALVISIVLMHTPYFKHKPPKIIIWFAQFGLGSLKTLKSRFVKKRISPENKRQKEKEMKNVDLEANDEGTIETRNNEDDYQEQWRIASRDIERKMFYIFAIVLFAVPFCIIMLFPSKGRA